MLPVPPRRALVLLAAVAAVACLPAVALPAPIDTSSADALLQARVLGDLNATRMSHGLAPLKLSRALDASATLHSHQMLADGYFGHQSPNGSLYWQRIERFYSIVPDATWSVGENLLWVQGSLPASRAVRIWMGDPGHRANLLSRRWRQVGISAVVERDAPGVFGGRSVTVVTADFGER